MTRRKLLLANIAMLGLLLALGLFGANHLSPEEQRLVGTWLNPRSGDITVIRANRTATFTGHSIVQNFSYWRADGHTLFRTIPPKLNWIGEVRYFFGKLIGDELGDQHCSSPYTWIDDDTIAWPRPGGVIEKRVK